MKKKASKKFFIRFFLLSVLSVVNVIVCIIITADAENLTIVAVLISINFLLLLFSFIKAFINLVRNIFNKENDSFEFLYVINFLFTFLVIVIFSTLLLLVFAAAIIILLPFLA